MQIDARPIKAKKAKLKMNWNSFYHNDCPEFQILKHHIWLFNNYIPPLPKQPHPTAKCFKEAFEGHKSRNYLEYCKSCNNILNVCILTDQIKKSYIVVYDYFIYQNGIYCRNCGPSPSHSPNPHWLHIQSPKEGWPLHYYKSTF